MARVSLTHAQLETTRPAPGAVRGGLFSGISPVDYEFRVEPRGIWRLGCLGGRDGPLPMRLSRVPGADECLRIICNAKRTTLGYCDKNSLKHVV